ncbi:MAG: glycosyltransferase family 4 protein [Anaerolineae bacterium]|nr:glycosyltransferase family 4 protein [Anaerolineae bacterium]
MLVGIDASRATAARPTGTENYSLHLIRALLSLDTPHRWRLYFNQPPADDLFGTLGEQRTIPFPRLWTHLALSWEMITHPPDLLFVPSHVLPIAHPARSVVTVHDLGFHYHPEAHTLTQNIYLRWSTRHNARAATRLLADSDATRHDLIELYGVPSSKIDVVYPGRDESLAPATDPAIRAAIRARYHLTAPYLLYIGTLHPRKNLTRLIQAFSRLLSHLPTPRAHQPTNLHLVLAGQKGWLYDDIFALVRRLGLEERVIFTGYVPDPDKPALLSGALAFVFPSLYEGFGIPVVEAMACGTPIICSNTSSLPEVAGDAALLVDPLDLDSIAGAMAHMVADADLRQTLAGRGLRQAQRFSWRRCAREALAVIEQVGRGVD